MEKVQLNTPDIHFLKDIESESGQVLAKCYQCGNCTAGCPMAFTFDIPVSRIMRLIQAGQRDVVLSSTSLSLCVSCETCTERCPNSIDIAKIMDICRHLSQREGKSRKHGVLSFKKAFMHSLRMNGRMHEIGTMLEFILRTGRIFTDVDLVPKILPKGKMSILPHRTSGKKEVQNIMERYAEGRPSLCASKPELNRRNEENK